MKVSVIIPTYNYACHIGKAIASVLEQDYPAEDLEIIVVDDGSTDDTETVIRGLQLQHAFIRYYRQDNLGKAAATQRAITVASGEVIFNLDADDYYLPGKIVKTLSVFEKHPAVVHVATPARVIFNDGKPSYNERIPSDLFEKVLDGKYLLNRFFSNKLLFGGGSTFAAKSYVLKQMTWHKAIDMYSDEWMLIETLLKGASYFMKEPLNVWQVHGRNYSYSTGLKLNEVTHKRLLESSETILALLQKNGYPEWLQKRYRLKHEARKMLWLEALHKKDMSSIFWFIRKGILSGNSLSVLNKYHSFRRLFPSHLIELFKRPK